MQGESRARKGEESEEAGSAPDLRFPESPDAVQDIAVKNTAPITRCLAEKEGTAKHITEQGQDRVIHEGVCAADGSELDETPHPLRRL